MRIIARLDIKNEWVIKGIQLEGLRKVGEPVELAKAYYETGIHEIFFMDAVASLYDRNNLFHIIEKACEEIFVPISIGGGLRTLDDVANALAAGADKVAINTGAVKNLDLISEIASRYGSQCIIGSIEAKRKSDCSWQAYIDNGREPTGFDVLEWVQKLEAAGAGEVLLTSVDQEGTRRGFDVDLFTSVSSVTSCPIILSGGYGEQKHIQALRRAGELPNAVAVASVLHYKQQTPSDLIQQTEQLDSMDVAA